MSYFACTGEYIVNREPSSSLQRSTVPCPERLPSCIGLPDGKQEFPNRRWWADYIVCYHNRTLEINKCADGYFNPYLRICVRWIPLSKLFFSFVPALMSLKFLYLHDDFSF